MDISALPPMPDPRTGLPRPPQAPVEKSWKPDTRDLNHKGVPKPPPGQSPVLEYYRSSKKSAIETGAGAMALIVAYGTLRLHGLGWIIQVRAWPLWLIAVSMIPAYYFSLRGDRITAGADWMQYRNQWVRTYEIASITLNPSGPKLVLQLIDRQEHKLRIPWYFIQKNRALWDLVYNGILHSVYVGHAETDLGARRHLKLPRPTT